MKKIIFTLAAICMLAIAATGQDLIDVVYLKNGKVIKGSIVKPLDENGVQIMDSNSDVFTFSADEVRRVTREKMVHENQKNVLMAHDGEGFTNITWLTYGFGIGSFDIGDVNVDNDNSYWGIHTINGYHINELISLGFGIGVDFFNVDTEGLDGFELLPIFADVRFTPVRKVMAPFFYADAGYSLGAFESDVDGGAMFGLGGGAQWSLSQNAALAASFGYRFQAHAFENVEEFNANYLNFKLAFKF
jgi:hypothetical protein